MSVDLYDITVPRYRQITGALVGVIDKAIDHCKTSGIDPAPLMSAKLFPDMLAFKDQISSVILLSVGAIESAEGGNYSPPPLGVAPYTTLAEAKTALIDALTQLGDVTPARINALEQKEVTFTIPAINLRMPFTGVGFFSSFSLPNFYFHASTAYGILRANGVPLGKGDFLGQMEIKP